VRGVRGDLGAVACIADCMTHRKHASTTSYETRSEHRPALDRETVWRTTGALHAVERRKLLHAILAVGCD